MNAHIKALLSFLEEDPSDAFSRYALALEYLKANDVDKALEHLQQLLDSRPDYLASYYQLGKILELKGKKNQAGAIYEKGKEVARKQGNMHTLNELNAALDSLID